MIAIIPARSGSTRIPGKNIKPFYDRPIIAYSIQYAEQSGLYDEIYVSTDSAQIANVAAAHGASVIKRSPAMAQNEVGTQEVMRDALTQIGVVPEFCSCIYATSPLMSVDDLRRGMQMLINNRSMNYAFSVGTEPLQDAGQFYHGRSIAFIENRPLVSPYSIMVPIASERVCDINTPEDWAKAEKMFASLGRRE